MFDTLKKVEDPCHEVLSVNGDDVMILMRHMRTRLS